MKTNENKSNLVELICGGVFFFVGICLLIGAVIAFLSNQKFEQNAHTIEAVITDIHAYSDYDDDMNYDVWVTYTIDESEYTERINFYSSSMHEGETIDILVDMTNPTRVRSVSGNVFIVFFLTGMGLVFSFLGGCFLLILLRRKIKKNKMIAAGYYVYAEVTGSFLCHNYSVNGKHPYKLECKYEDVFSGISHTFTSDYIWTDPQPYIGGQVKVYCNRDFSGAHYVDIESLQRLIQ